MSKWLDRHLKGIYVTPSLIFIILMIIAPLAYNFAMSFTDWQMSAIKAPQFVGLKNYIDVFKDERFRMSVWRTVIFSGIAITLEGILGVEELKPHLATGAAGALGKVVIGTVAGDLHDIGKNLVAMMIESAGFDVIDLGVDVPVEKFVDAAAAEGVKIVACSALLTTTMPALEATVAALRAAGKDYRIMVGGAPITQEFADRIGADAYTADAASAAKKARELVG